MVQVTIRVKNHTIHGRKGSTGSKATEAAAQQSGGGGRPRRARTIVDTKRKTEICRNWLKGQCSFGAACAFAHGENELKLRTLVSDQMGDTGRVPSANEFCYRPCMAWVATGSCPSGRRCGFIHDPRVRGLYAFCSTSWAIAPDAAGPSSVTCFLFPGMARVIEGVEPLTPPTRYELAADVDGILDVGYRTVYKLWNSFVATFEDAVISNTDTITINGIPTGILKSGSSSVGDTNDESIDDDSNYGHDSSPVASIDTSMTDTCSISSKSSESDDGTPSSGLQPIAAGTPDRACSHRDGTASAADSAAYVTEPVHPYNQGPGRLFHPPTYAAIAAAGMSAAYIASGRDGGVVVSTRNPKQCPPAVPGTVTSGGFRRFSSRTDVKQEVTRHLAVFEGLRRGKAVPACLLLTPNCSETPHDVSSESTSSLVAWSPPTSHFSTSYPSSSPPSSKPENGRVPSVGVSSNTNGIDNNSDHHGTVRNGGTVASFSYFSFDLSSCSTQQLDNSGFGSFSLDDDGSTSFPEGGTLSSELEEEKDEADEEKEGDRRGPGYISVQSSPRNGLVEAGRRISGSAMDNHDSYPLSFARRDGYGQDDETLQLVQPQVRGGNKPVPHQSSNNSNSLYHYPLVVTSCSSNRFSDHDNSSTPASRESGIGASTNSTSTNADANTRSFAPSGRSTDVIDSATGGLQQQEHATPDVVISDALAVPSLGAMGTAFDFRRRHSSENMIVHNLDEVQQRQRQIQWQQRQMQQQGYRTGGGVASVGECYQSVSGSVASFFHRRYF